MENISAADADSPEKSMLASRSVWVFSLLVSLSILNVWPFFWFQYLPFMDHPSHLLKANILAHLHSPLFEYDRFFTANPLPVPNLLSDYLIAFLGQVLSIDIASRMVIGLAMVGLPLSVWFYLSKTRPGTEPWAFFAVPMVWSLFLFFGNENFCLAVPLLFLLLGLLGPQDSRWSRRTSATLLGLATLIYFSHFLVFAVAGLALTLHFLFGQRDLRRAVLHFAPVAPGSLFTLVWFSQKKAEGIRAAWSFNLFEKLGSFTESLCPVPWGSATQSIAWQCFCLSLFAFLGLRACRLFSAPAMRWPIVLFCLSCGIAFCLQRWVIIFIPDQRMWWIAFLIGFAFLPRISEKSYVNLGVFVFPLVVGTAVSVGALFSVPNQQLAQVEEAFSNFPKGMRLLYFGDPALPPHLHRVFEYYHLRKGGRSTMQFAGKDQAVVYKEGCFLTPLGPQFEIYAYSATAWIPYLAEFDGALIVGDPGPAVDEIIETLTINGFRVASSGVITLLLSPNVDDGGKPMQ